MMIVFDERNIILWFSKDKTIERVKNGVRGEKSFKAYKFNKTKIIMFINQCTIQSIKINTCNLTKAMGFFRDSRPLLGFPGPGPMYWLNLPPLIGHV
jgi:hypothetical protein